MTDQDEKILLTDICARIPYGVMCDVDYYDGPLVLEGIPNTDTFLFCNGVIERYASQVRPYLRPMSSMTEEEITELHKEHLKDERMFTECIERSKNGDDSMRGKVITHFAVDWCNKKMFDYRGLIEKGLALEAPEGMYN